MTKLGMQMKNAAPEARMQALDLAILLLVDYRAEFCGAGGVSTTVPSYHGIHNEGRIPGKTKKNRLTFNSNRSTS